MDDRVECSAAQVVAIREHFRRPAPDRDRVSEYWSWFAVALFLLLTVDILTSIGAATRTDLEAEANPFMRWLFTQDIALIVAVHLAVLVVAVGGFWALMYFRNRTPEPIDRYFDVVIEAWIGLLVALGLFIFANNMAVIVFKTSLL